MKLRLARIAGCLAIAATMAACAQSAGSPPSGASNAITLAWHPQYVGVAGDSCTVFSECFRGPAYNMEVPVSQANNPAAFSVSSTNPSVASGQLVMTGPAAQSGPAIGVNPHKAGSTILTVTGTNGATASLPVTVTTISQLTITLNGLPTAAFLEFNVSAPKNAQCPSFEGGYSFLWDVATPPSVTAIQNFPAMGAGPLSACVFSSVAVSVTDATNKTLATKAVTLPIVVGADNPAAITIP